MKLGELESFISTLTILKDKELPFHIAYKISSLIKIVENDYNFYTEKVKEILNEYAQKDKEGKYIIDKNGNVPFKEDCVEEAQRKIQELKEVEGQEINIIFSTNELDSLSLTPAQLMPLLPFIVE